MLTYLIILLDDTSTSYCHYEVTKQERRLIALDDLKAGILFAMKENLNIQFVYPDYELPEEYLAAIDSIDHTKIMPARHGEEADVIVLGGWDDEVQEGATCIVRCTRKELADNLQNVRRWLGRVARLNVVFTDVEAFSDSDIDSYKATLETLADCLVEEYRKGKAVQLSLLTDRMLLTEMNNCNAGDTNVTLAPNGRFYLCPAFYYEEIVSHASERDDSAQQQHDSAQQQRLAALPTNSVGSLRTGLDIKNRQLLRLDYAPLCRHCDAYQCKRCIWHNQRLTLDANTPSHQQCVMAHLERNASRRLLQKLEEAGISMADAREIEEIDYLDPFNVYNRWK